MLPSGPVFALAVLAFVLAVALLGALGGLGLAWLHSRAFRGQPGPSWRDALTGAVALSAVNVTYGVLDGHINWVNGEAVGPRGILLNHVTGWAFTAVSVAVVGIRLVAHRRAIHS